MRHSDEDVGADALVDGDGGLVPVEDGPLEAGAAFFYGDGGRGGRGGLCRGRGRGVRVRRRGLRGGCRGGLRQVL